MDDTAFGGSGADLFIYGSDLSTGSQVIGDFDGVSLNAANGEDKIAFKTGMEVGSFSYIAGAAFSGGGNSEARFAGSETLEIDIGGDGLANAMAVIDGLNAANRLTATGFLWF